MQSEPRKEFLFGMISRRTKTLRNTPLNDHSCSNCGLNATQLITKIGYADFGGIPLYPMDKEIEVTCHACEYILKESEFTTPNQELALQLKHKMKYPWFRFLVPYVPIGLILLLAFILTIEGVYKGRINNPELYDVYVVYHEDLVSDYKYSLWRVVTVDTDSLWITTNTYNYDKPPTIMHPLDQFYDSMFWMGKQKVMDLYKEGVIVSVDRDLHPRGEVFERLNMPDPGGF